MTPAEQPCSLREHKKQQTREAIHDAAYRLVVARGLHHVTVGDICAEATISERTFFNYFPSKAAAALGLPGTTSAPEDEERFLAARGRIVDDVCVLVAATVDLHKDELPRVRELIRLEPDLLGTVKQWTASLRKRIVQLAEHRTSPERARLAVALVFAALLLHADSEFTIRGTSAEELAETIARLASVGAEPTAGQEAGEERGLDERLGEDCGAVPLPA